MKAQAPAVWIAGASVLAIIGVLSFSLAYQVQSVVRGQHERTMVEALNEMEFVKKAVPQAAVYSAYQSAYETLKYGVYSSSGCDPEKLDGLPYWKTYEASCEPTDLETPFENKLKEIFGEYISKIREQADKINIKLPSYQVSSTVSESDVEIIAKADGKLTFETDRELFTDKQDVKQKIKLPLERLIKFGVEEFVKKDPFAPKIQAAKDAMSSVALDNSLIKNPGWSTPDLNGGRLTGNCKSTTFKTCVDPTWTPDFTYSYPPKADLITGNCEVTLKAKIVENINTLNKDSKYHISPTDASVETKSNLVKVDIDINDETTCQTPTPDADSGSCDCIKWACTGNTPVVFGAPDSTLQLSSTIVVPGGQQCSPCIDITGNTCIQSTGKVCPSGYNPRDVNGNGNLENNECVKVSSPSCPAGHPDEFNGQCYKVKTCSDDQKCDPSAGCVADEGNVAHDVCWYDTILKVCPTDTTPNGNECWSNVQKDVGCPSNAPFEFGNTGRCYKPTQLAACTLHKTLYTKTCDYSYNADATTLVKVKDTANKYPVYDNAEEKTDFRNLELQFLVSSQS